MKDAVDSPLTPVRGARAGDPTPCLRAGLVPRRSGVPTLQRTDAANAGCQVA